MEPEMFDQTIVNILDFAIKREEEAHQFYTELATKVSSKHLSAVLLDFAREELGHKAKLLGIKNGLITISSPKPVQDLKIADFLVDVVATEEMDFQQVLIIAMKREKAAYKLYMDLANAVADNEVRQTLLILANEEAKHKLRFEIEYDELMIEN